MNTPIIPIKPRNDEIIATLELMCLNHIEESPEGKALIAKRDELIVQAGGEVGGAGALGDLSDLFMTWAVHYGSAMFRFALEFGLNPSSIFDLPNESE